ncbi:MAG: cyclin family protein, partial [Candidatus Aenigmatarchaeota archaeon]
KAVAVMLERIDATDSSRENAKRIVDKVKENQAKFSGKSRFSIAAAVVYFAIEDEADMKEIIKVGSISPASLKNMIETMESRINLN